MNSNPLPVNVLMILDGWGIRDEKKGNAFALAETPFLDSLLKSFPSCKLKCSGNAVGLPDGTMGNSEVGHMNIGAGRKVLQNFVKINQAIKDTSFFKTPALLDIMAQVSKSKNADAPKVETPLDMLKKRYANGEIDIQEYEEKSNALKKK